jgi:nucleotide-binding universal stress UspA family protein
MMATATKQTSTSDSGRFQGGDEVEASDQLTVSHEIRRPLLVATDGTESADTAIAAAYAIASRTGQPVELIAVHAPIPVVAAEVQLATTSAMEAEACASLLEQVELQLNRLRVGADWAVQVVSGDPAASIVKAAQQSGAALIVMGIGGHGIVDRIIGDELVLRVLRLGRTPVLAAAPSFLGLPTRAVAAVDFSSSSVRALRCALDVVAPRGAVTLAHVVSRDLDPSNWLDANGGYRGTIGRAFDRVIGEVGASDIALSRRVVAGDPAKEVTQLAKMIGAELIVAGSHGHNFLTRLLLGSVSTRLVRSGVCSVLVAPPDDSPDFIAELPRATKVYGSYEWAERLEEFTRRNAGRRATLEVIDPDIGAQVEERDMLFMGASFDPRDARVQIMFAGTSPDAHLTRSIVGVTAIQSLRDAGGKDLLLRVAHGRGQSLVTLER